MLVSIFMPILLEFIVRIFFYMSYSGIPMEVINKFKHGFPKDWLELIQEHIACQSKQGNQKQRKQKQAKPKIQLETEQTPKIRSKPINKDQKSAKDKPRKSKTSDATAVSKGKQGQTRPSLGSNSKKSANVGNKKIVLEIESPKKLGRNSLE